MFCSDPTIHFDHVVRLDGRQTIGHLARATFRDGRSVRAHTSESAARSDATLAQLELDMLRTAMRRSAAELPRRQRSSSPWSGWLAVRLTERTLTGHTTEVIRLLQRTPVPIVLALAPEARDGLAPLALARLVETFGDRLTIALDGIGTELDRQRIGQTHAELLFLDRAVIEAAVESRPVRALAAALVDEATDERLIVIGNAVEHSREDRLLWSLGLSLASITSDEGSPISFIKGARIPSLPALSEPAPIVLAEAV